MTSNHTDVTSYHTAMYDFKFALSELKVFKNKLFPYTIQFVVYESHDVGLTLLENAN